MNEFCIMQEGGLNGFLHSFIAEVMAICRSHVAALGGNALVAYYMSECVVEANVHKNQASVCRHAAAAVRSPHTRCSMHGTLLQVEVFLAV